jgi:hypothetical protein
MSSAVLLQAENPSDKMEAASELSEHFRHTTRRPEASRRRYTVPPRWTEGAIRRGILSGTGISVGEFALGAMMFGPSGSAASRRRP